MTTGGGSMKVADAFAVVGRLSGASPVAWSDAQVETWVEFLTAQAADSNAAMEATTLYVASCTDGRFTIGAWLECYRSVRARAAAPANALPSGRLVSCWVCHDTGWEEVGEPVGAGVVRRCSRCAMPDGERRRTRVPRDEPLADHGDLPAPRAGEMADRDFARRWLRVAP